jgi:hypothetical protein
MGKRVLKQDLTEMGGSRDSKPSGSSDTKTKFLNDTFQFSLDELSSKKRVPLEDLNAYITAREIKPLEKMDQRQVAIATILLDMFTREQLILAEDAPQLGGVLKRVSDAVVSLESRMADMSTQMKSLVDASALTAGSQTASASYHHQSAKHSATSAGDQFTQVQTIKEEFLLMQDQPKQQEYESDLILFRVQESEAETTIELKSTVLSILSKITDDAVDADHIVQVFRVGAASKGKIRPVCVVFAKTARKVRALVLKNKSKLRQTAPQVFVDVRLTPLQLKIRARKQPIYDHLLKDGKRPFWRYDKLYTGVGPSATEVHTLPATLDTNARKTPFSTPLSSPTSNRTRGAQ